MTYPRISARRGSVVELDVNFVRGGILSDPFAILKVDIYRSQVAPHNNIGSFIVVNPCDPTYPAPINRTLQALPAGQCGTESQQAVPVVGKYNLLWNIPDDVPAPDAYFDVWTFLPTNPCLLDDYAASAPCQAIGSNGSSGTCGLPDINDPIFQPLLVQLCNRFWVYPEFWNSEDNLSTVRIGFEPLDQKFNQPEIRPLEIGIMPMPLYDYDFNLVAPIIPLLQGTITIETLHREPLVSNAPMVMGLRQGSYRSNPYVLRYNLDTTKFLIGTYKYRISVLLPDGTTRTSSSFNFTIS